LPDSCQWLWVTHHFTCTFHISRPPFLSLCPYSRASGPWSQTRRKERKGSPSAIATDKPTLSPTACTQRRYNDSHSFPLHPRGFQWECTCPGHWIGDCTQLCVRPALDTKPHWQGLAPKLEKWRMQPQNHSRQTELLWRKKGPSCFQTVSHLSRVQCPYIFWLHNQGSRLTAKIGLQQSEHLSPSAWCWFCNQSGSFIFNCCTNALQRHNCSLKPR